MLAKYILSFKYFKVRLLWKEVRVYDLNLIRFSIRLIGLEWWLDLTREKKTKYVEQRLTQTAIRTLGEYKNQFSCRYLRGNLNLRFVPSSLTVLQVAAECKKILNTVIEKKIYHETTREPAKAEIRFELKGVIYLTTRL